MSTGRSSVGTYVASNFQQVIENNCEPKSKNVRIAGQKSSWPVLNTQLFYSSVSI